MPIYRTGQVSQMCAAQSVYHPHWGRNLRNVSPIDSPQFPNCRDHIWDKSPAVVGANNLPSQVETTIIVPWRMQKTLNIFSIFNNTLYCKYQGALA